ncbi:MAG: glycosyltransferase family 4 protein [Proteobacteria bacterium]|nr:glycosyltransferase family 4 protein [Pseudomonadota bacterium]
MRIALVVPGGVDRTGEYRVIPALLALLQRLSRTHEVEVFTLAQEPAPGTWRLAGAQIHNIGARDTRRRAVGAILARHRRLRFDLIQAIWSGACGLVAVTAGTVLRIPVTVHVAGGELAALPEINYGGRLSWRGRAREWTTLHLASAVTAASAPTIKTLEALGVRAQRVPLGVDLGAWPPREPVPRDPARPARLLHVASLNRVKDQATLLRALTTLPRAGAEWLLDIVGEDTLSGEIQALAQQLGMSDRVSFHGFLTQRQLRPLVESAHLLVMSSRHETGPLVALEAAVVGVPTAGTAVGHIAEWAPQAALAVPVADPVALGSAIAVLLQDEPLRMRIAHQARQRAVVEDADHTANSLEAIYNRLARGRRRGS